MIGPRYPLLLAFVSSGLLAADLKPETGAAFDRYVKLTEDGFAKHQGFEDFLWLDQHADQKSLVWLGQSVVSPGRTLDQGAEIEVPDGVLQHWIGVVYLEGATLERARDAVLNFDSYKNFFKQQVAESKLNKRDGEQFDVFLRLYKRQVSAVVLNVNETAKYTLIDPARVTVACRSSRISEAEHSKKKKSSEPESATDDAAGYLWRLNLYWRLQQSDNGVYAELETLSLAREAGTLSPSRLLNGFQSFPRELTQGMIDGLKDLFPHHR